MHTYVKTNRAVLLTFVDFLYVPQLKKESRVQSGIEISRVPFDLDVLCLGHLGEPQHPPQLPHPTRVPAGTHEPWTSGLEPGARASLHFGAPAPPPHRPPLPAPARMHHQDADPTGGLISAPGRFWGRRAEGRRACGQRKVYNDD